MFAGYAASSISASSQHQRSSDVPSAFGFKKLFITEVRKKTALGLAVSQVTNETYYGCEISEL